MSSSQLVADSSQGRRACTAAELEVHDFLLDFEDIPAELVERCGYFQQYMPKYWTTIAELEAFNFGSRKAQREADEMHSWICDVHEEMEALRLQGMKYFEAISHSSITYVANHLIKPRYLHMLQEYHDNKDIIRRLKLLAISWSNCGWAPANPAYGADKIHGWMYLFVEVFPFMVEAAFPTEQRSSIFAHWLEALSEASVDYHREVTESASD